ncbi:hypothetical protein GI584_22215 [Gracilibacillus salitolerans]|uniref:DUF2268 domain-containing protein n=1 Tax=Gracilibacillus salitolerans TaxID=2663022 RepID=A0A5Q2TQX9_9BACI|nr:DUF2268 domain-containing putative Zn-dependent protease [Gracilibacillus salitolerans]QGH36601.1 hypothetical protein GI584_22215 [Gracilibacillus salitolerans]
MTIYATDKWIKKFTDKKDDKDRSELHLLHQSIICEPLTKFFEGIPSEAIQEHLLRHGLFSSNLNKEDAQKWIQQNYLSKVNNIYKKCKNAWNGPEPDIFIFPSNEEIRELKEWYNSNAGLSYPDKLFLFLQKNASNREIVALFLHEYSHICRLHHFPKKEMEYTLLDAIILEGIAEWIVRKKVGAAYGNKRIERVTDEILEDLWKKWIAPLQHLKRDHPKHDMIMYGLNGVPKNIGYIIGYNIIQRYMEKQKDSITTLLQTPNHQILAELDSLTDK